MHGVPAPGNRDRIASDAVVLLAPALVHAPARPRRDARIHDGRGPGDRPRDPVMLVWHVQVRAVRDPPPVRVLDARMQRCAPLRLPPKRNALAELLDELRLGSPFRFDDAPELVDARD